MRTYLFLLILFLLIGCASTIHAETVRVPDDFPTIQAGIDACVDGDTVLVADGTYTGDGNRSIDFLGKAIVVMSENGPEVTIIDCEGSETEPHRGFYFYNGEEGSSVVQGFTITNGWIDGYGGGMLMESSSPMVTNCTFSGNYATRGGGMYNSYSNPMVTNCTFSGNSAGSSGGGMYNGHSSPIITNCTFSGNTSSEAGGGMFNYNSDPTITNCTFSGNSAEHHSGGGMYSQTLSSPTVTNCTFSQNSTGLNGGGMYNHQSSTTVINCTFSGNSAENIGGGIRNAYCNPIVTNCILWGDIPDEIANYDSDPIVTYSDVEGGYTGMGNIDEDPLFVSFHGFDYLLGRGSPCIDAGDPAIEDGREWPIWYNNGLRSDMGAYGGPGNVGWLQ